MKLFTKEKVYELLCRKYKLDEVLDEKIKSIYQNNLKEFLNEIYDLSKMSVETLSEKQTFTFRKKYGILDGGIYQTNDSIANELGISTQAVAQRINRIITKTIPRIIYKKEKNVFIESNGNNLKKLKILSIPIEKLGFSQKTYNCLHVKGIAKLGDFLSLSTEDITSIKSCGEKTCKEIIAIVHSYGIKFSDELEKDQALDILKNVHDKVDYDDNLKLPIELLGFSNRAFKCLKNAGIDTIEKLVNLSTFDLTNIKGLGPKVFEELMELMHSYGLKFVDEREKEQTKTIIENIEKTNGDDKQIFNLLLLPIEVIELSTRVYNCLKRQGITTLQDLVNLSTYDLIKIKGLGKNMADEIITKVSNYCLSFASVKTSEPVEEKNYDITYEEPVLQQIEKRKEELVIQYRKLQIEKVQLLAKEAEIDKEMNQIMMELTFGRKEEEHVQTKRLGRNY